MTKEELEKEAEEYISDNCKRWESDGLTVDDIANEAYLAGAEPREKRIAELEKENAELKEQCSILADCNICTSTCKTENIEMKTQLTKAKDLLAKWVELFKPKLEGYPITPIQEQTEQFLSEVEK